MQAEADRSVQEKNTQMKERGTLLAIGGLLLVAGLFYRYYFRPTIRLGYVDSAIANIRTIVKTEKEFAEHHQKYEYACTFSELSSSDTVERLAKNRRIGGYIFELHCTEQIMGGSHTSFRITARPIDADMPAYCADESGIVRYDEGGSTERCLRTGTSL